MKSIKKKNCVLVPLGVALFILGITFVIASALQENTGNGDAIHFGGDAGSVTIVTNIDWLQIGLLIVGFIIMCFGGLMLTFYFLFKGDFINVENGMVTCRGDLKNYTIPLKEVEYCKSKVLPKSRTKIKFNCHYVFCLFRL